MTDIIRIWGDKNYAPGTNPINIINLLTPAAPGYAGISATAPTSVTLDSGNATGHFTFNGTTLDVSTSGQSGGMSSETYTLTFTANFEKYTRVFDVIYHFPPLVRYVDGIGGSDSNDGLTKGTAWQNIPGAPNATGNASSFNPGSSNALINIKGDITYRISSKLNAISRCYYGSVLYGTNKPEITTFNTLATPVAATQGEVYNNTNWTNIKKFAGITFNRSQPVRNNTTLSFPAQFPAAGADPYIDSQEPTVDGSRGMRHLALSNLTTLSSGTGGTGPWTYRLRWAELVSTFGSIDFTNYTLWLWAGANHIIPVLPTSYNTTTGDFEFTITSELLTTFGYVAVNITGHPAFITAQNQHAWADGNSYAWIPSGQTTESSSSQTVFDIGNASNGGGTYNLDFSGGFSTSADSVGGGVVTATAGPLEIGYKVWYCNFKHFISDESAIAAIRTQGAYISGNWSIGRNIIKDTFRASGIRLSTNGNNDHYIYDNYLSKIGFTSIYSANAVGLKCIGNIIADCQSTHGNGISFYDVGGVYTGSITSGTNTLTMSGSTNMGYFAVGRYVRIGGAGTAGADLIAKITNIASFTVTLDANANTTITNGSVYLGVVYNVLIERNWIRNTTRPFTLQGWYNSTIRDSLFEIDGNLQEASSFWSDAKNILIERSIFTHKSGVARLNSTDTLYSRGTGTINKCVIDGSTTGTNRLTSTNNLYVFQSGNEPSPLPWSNVAPDANNKFESQSVWSGTIPSSWKRTLGVGNIGPTEYVGDLSQLTFTTQLDVARNTIVESNWAQLITDSTSRTITVSGGIEYRVADDNTGTNATAWGSTSSSAAANKWIQLRRTTSTSGFEVEVGTVDQGDGMSDTWTTRTLRLSDWPAVTRYNTWRTTTTSTFATPSTLLTVAIMGIKRATGSAAWGNGDTVFGQATTSPIGWRVETVIPSSTNRLRFTVKNASDVSLCSFQTPTFEDGITYDVIVTFDTSKATFSEAVKLYINNVDQTASAFTVTYNAAASGGQDIAFGQNVNWYCVGLGSTTEVGAWFAHPDWLDITVASNRAKFSSLQMGDKGAYGLSVFGTQPRLLLVGTQADWQNANGTTVGPQRGTINQLSNINAATVTTPEGASLTWPVYTYANTITLETATSVGYVNSPISVDLKTNGAVGIPRTINITDGNSGGLSPVSPVTLSSVDTSQTINLVYTPTVQGSRTLTASPADSSYANATASFTVNQAIANTFTVSGTNYTTVGTTVPYTITLNGSNPSGMSVNVNLSGLTGIVESPVSIPAGATSATFNVTYTSGGTGSLVFTNGSGLANPSNVVLSIAIVVEPGQTVNLTRQQASTIRIKGSGDFTVKWKRNTYEKGETDGVRIHGQVT